LLVEHYGDILKESVGKGIRNRREEGVAKKSSEIADNKLSPSIQNSAAPLNSK